MNTIRFFLLISCFAIVSCSSKVTSTTSGTTAEKGKYSEDLSALRPKVQLTDTARSGSAAPTGVGNRQSKYVEPKFAVTASLDNVLDSISSMNRSNGYVDGFTIQVYSGIKREDAFNAKRLLSTSLPELNAEVQFVQPNYRVRAGKYYDRVEAQKDYLVIKRFFPNAIVLPDRIEIK